MSFPRVGPIAAMIACSALACGAADTRLFDAIASGQLSAAQALIKQGVDVNIAQPAKMRAAPSRSCCLRPEPIRIWPPRKGKRR
jgi:hypothetical protein